MNNKEKNKLNILSFVTHLLLACAILLCFIFPCIKSAAAGNENEKPEFNPDESVDIVIDLQDDTRFMTLTLYRIGDYDGERFAYTDEILRFMEKDYYKLSRETEKQSAAEVLSGLIPKETEPESFHVWVSGGKGEAEGLTSGLYLVVQNKKDQNAVLEKPFIVEAPGLSEDKTEYLYDVRVFPKWDREVWFTFRKEVVHPILIAAILALLVALCLVGAKSLRVVLVGSSFALSGLFGMTLVSFIDGFEYNFLWFFVVFLIFAFLGVGIMWGIITALSAPVKKIHADSFLRKNLFWMTALAGATGMFYLMYRFLLGNVMLCAVISVSAFILGCILQKLQQKNEVHFYTYEDLIRMSPKEEDILDEVK